MQVTVIIVNYKVPHYLLYCLYSVQRALKNIASEILVVDNASRDDSEALVRQHFPEVIWYALPENIGFGRANNHALHHAKGLYTVFLNPDTLVPENLFSYLLTQSNSLKKMGILGVQLVDGSGQFLPESKREKPTILGSFFKVLGLAEKYPHHRWLNKYALGLVANHANTSVAILPGAFMFASTELLLKVGGFDERYFMYGEDIDLCVTVLNAGYNNWYLGSEKIIHFKGESTVKSSANYAHNFFGAMHLYVKKYYSAWYHTPITYFLQRGVQWAKKRKKMQAAPPQPAPIQEFWCIGSYTSFEILQKTNLTTPLHWVKSIQAVPTNAAVLWLLGNNFEVANAIEIMCKHIGQHPYYWYFAHAPAVIGSSSKHLPGRVIITSKTLQ